jgi:hypothetical protein
VVTVAGQGEVTISALTEFGVDRLQIVHIEKARQWTQSIPTGWRSSNW